MMFLVYSTLIRYHLLNQTAWCFFCKDHSVCYVYGFCFPYFLSIYELQNVIKYEAVYSSPHKWLEMKMYCNCKPKHGSIWEDRKLIEHCSRKKNFIGIDFKKIFVQKWARCYILIHIDRFKTAYKNWKFANITSE